MPKRRKFRKKARYWHVKKFGKGYKVTQRESGAEAGTIFRKLKTARLARERRESLRRGKITRFGKWWR